MRRMSRSLGALGYNFLPAAQAGVGIASHFAPVVGQVASKAGFFSGAGAAAMLTNPVTIAIEAGLAALPAVINLFKCGTVGQVGCQKRDDATVDLQGRAAMRQLLYQVETGQISAADAQAQMQQIAAAMQQSYHRQEDWSRRAGPDYACGAWLSQGPGCGQQVCPGLAVPASSFAATFNCGKQYSSYGEEIGALIAAAKTAAARAPRPAASSVSARPAIAAAVPPGSPIQSKPPSPPASAPATSSSKSWLPWLLGAGAGVVALATL